MARRVQVEGSRARGSSTAREPARPIGAGRARLPPLEAALESNGEWHGGQLNLPEPAARARAADDALGQCRTAVDREWSELGARFSDQDDVPF